MGRCNQSQKKLLRDGGPRFHAERSEGRAVCGVSGTRHVRADGVAETVGSMLSRARYKVCKRCVAILEDECRQDDSE